MIRVTVWNEYKHEREKEEAKKIYPEGIHAVIAEFLKNADFIVRTATFNEGDCGLSEEVLNDTDVLVWWGMYFMGRYRMRWLRMYRKLF